MGGDTRSDALFIEFIESYRAFCRHNGHKLPTATGDSWVTWWGPMRLDLRTLFDNLQQNGSLDAQTDLETWQQVSRSISCSNSTSQQQPQLLPAETVRQLFCTHLAGFRNYQQAQQVGCGGSCRTKTRQLARRQQQTMRQQQQQQLKHRHKKQQQTQHPQEVAHGCSVTRAARAGKRSCRRRASTASAAANGAGSTSSSLAEGQQGTAAAPAPAAGVRRSRRACVQPVRLGFVQSDNISHDTGVTSGLPSNTDDGDTHSSAAIEAENAEQLSVLLGPAFQAELPRLQQRPASPTAVESKFLTGPLHVPAAWRHEGQQQQQQQRKRELPSPVLALPPGHFHAQWVAASSGAARLQLLQQWLQCMDEAMGQGMAERLGLGLLGFKLQAAWSPQEELLFALGMLEQYRLFRHMRRHYLPQRSVHELNGYYYSVWKTRAGRVAEEYALLCERNGDVVEFRQLLCTRLAAIWDKDSMGPIPPAAALPPARAAKAAVAAPAAPKAAATAAPAGVAAPKSKPTVPQTQTAAAAASAPSAAADDRLVTSTQAASDAAAAADSSSPGEEQHSLQTLKPAAGSTGMGAKEGVRSGGPLPSLLTLNDRSSSSGSSGSLPLAVQPPDASSSEHCSLAAAEQRHSSAGCGSGSSWPCVNLVESDSADDGEGGAAEAAARHARKRARVSGSSGDGARDAGCCRPRLGQDL